MSIDCRIFCEEGKKETLTLNEIRTYSTNKYNEINQKSNLTKLSSIIFKARALLKTLNIVNTRINDQKLMFKSFKFHLNHSPLFPCIKS